MIDYQILTTTFGMVFLAELGDKTQLATFCLAADCDPKLSVFIGAGAALLLSTLIAVVFGPWQPAPLLAWARPFGLPGFAGQSSSSASFSSGSGTGSIGGRGQASGSHWANHGSI